MKETRNKKLFGFSEYRKNSYLSIDEISFHSFLVNYFFYQIVGSKNFDLILNQRRILIFVKIQFNFELKQSKSFFSSSSKLNLIEELNKFDFVN